MERFIVADVETTGMDHDAGIVEIAWIEIDENLKEIQRFRSLIDPEIPISPGAMGVHHISDAMVADEPTMAHNAVFDYRFIHPHIPIKESVCTLRLARYVWPDAPDHRIQTLRYHFGLEGGRGAHGALQDCETTLSLLRYLCASEGYTLSDLRGMCKGKLPVKRASFGKYKGELLSNIPPGYRRWLLSIDIDQDLRHSLERI